MKSRLPDPYRHKSSPLKRERSAQPKKSPVLKALQLVTIATTGGAVILASLAGLAFLRSGSQFIEGVKLALTPQPPKETVDVRSVVVEQVQNVSELTTAVFTMEAVVPTQSDRKLGEVTIGQTNLLYIAYGEVRAGVDLAEITADSVTTTFTESAAAGTALETTPAAAGSIENAQVTVVLPPPKILTTKIDVDRSTVYDYSRGWFNLGPDRGIQLQALAQQEAEAKIEQSACEQDILGQANERAELVVSQLLLSTGFKTVTVKTSPGEDIACQALPAQSS